MIGDLIPDEGVEAPAEEVERGSLREQLECVLEELSERERGVLRLRFGLGPGQDQPRTLEEVSRVYGVTRERVRQIEAKALRKLRRPDLSRPLQDYLE